MISVIRNIARKEIAFCKVNFSTSGKQLIRTLAKPSTAQVTTRRIRSKSMVSL